LHGKQRWVASLRPASATRRKEKRVVGPVGPSRAAPTTRMELWAEQGGAAESRWRSI
jgi:hypothetical protein